MSATLGAAATEAIDVRAERARTPGCATGHHFNSAGAALLATGTVEAVVAHLEDESLRGGYEAAREALPRLDAVYARVARLVGVTPAEVALVESATAGWQRAVSALRLRPGDRVLAARSSYVSSALQLLAAERERGIRVEVLPNGPDGAVDLAALERALRAGPVALVTAAHVPTSSGLIEPVEGIGALCRAHGAPFLLDATQSLGQLPVDMDAIGCDLLIGTGRKFLRGPRGTGMMAVRSPLLPRLEPEAPDVRGALWTAERSWELVPDAKRFELWEAAHALRLGLGSALADLAGLGVPAVAAHIAALGSRLRERLAALPGVRVSDPPAAGGGIVTFVVDGFPATEVQRELARRRVFLTTVPASHGRWDMDPRGFGGVVRASVHVYNDEADLDALVDGVREIAPAPAPTARVTRARTVDAVVVGLGVHGSAALHQLARRGRSVVGLERFRTGHDLGSSHGATRMIRRAYPHPVWDGLVDTAYRAWRSLEDEAGVELVRTTGGVYAAPLGRADPLRGPGCREIGREEAAEAFPGLRLPAGYGAVHDPRAGVIDAEGTLQAQLALAAAAGAEIRDGRAVTGWEPDGDDGVVVHSADGSTVRARRLVLCAGPWTGALVPSLAPALSVIRIVNAYFAADPAGPLGADALGAFSVDLPEGLLYGIAALDGRGLKVGLDSGPPCDPDAPRAPVSDAERAVLADAVRRLFPAAGALTEDLSCLYTMTQDRRFVVGELPGQPRVLVASACSGHGFKFGPVIGAALADLACGEERPDLAFLSPARLPLGAAR
ncbi:N-methyl-L-tryptophan oxidase [Streptomyces sp. NPDC059373]